MFHDILYARRLTSILIVGETKSNEKTIAAIEKSPFPFQDREYVSRLICRADSDGLSFSVAIWPAADVVDYGDSLTKAKIVRGKLKGIFTATNIGSIGKVKQCRLTYHVSIDAGGLIPPSVISSKIAPMKLMTVKSCITYFKRDEEVDNAALLALAETVRSEPQEYTSEEKEMIQKSRDFYNLYASASKNNNNYKRVKTPDSRVTTKGIHIDGDHMAAGKTTTVVDADVATCLAYCYIKDSRAARESRKKKRILEAAVRKINDHSQLYLSIRDIKVPGLANREWRCRALWEACGENGAYFLTFFDTQDLNEEFPVKANNVVASSHTVYLFEPLEKIGSIPQTRVTTVARVDIKGSVQTIFMKRLMVGYSIGVSMMRQTYDRSDEIDAENRLLISRRIRAEKSRSDEADYALKFAERIGKVKVKNAFPLAKNWVKVEGFGKGWGLASVSVTSTLEDAAAFFWDFESRAHTEVTGDTERSVLKRSSDFTKIVRRRQKLESKHGGMHHERVFLNKMSLHIVDENVIVIAMDPIQDHQEIAATYLGNEIRKIGSGRFATNAEHQATERVAVRFSRRGEKATKIEFTTELELGRLVSTKATRFCLERHLDEATDIERYFARQVELKDMIEKAGEALGHDMAWDGGQLGGAHSRGDRAKHVEEVIIKSKALSAVRNKYPWIVILMQRAREGALATNHSVSTKLSCVREEEARIIGNNLMPALKRNKTVAAGIDQWRRQNRAVDELFVEFPWMKGLFLALGQGVVNTAPWGMMWRVFIGALLSTIDLITDIFITYTFWKEDKIIFFKCSAAMLVSSMFLMVRCMRLLSCEASASSFTLSSH